MSTNLPDSSLMGLTGEQEIFLNRARQAAAQKIATANQQAGVTLGNARQSAHDTIVAAHKKATNLLCQNLQGLYILTDAGIAYADTNGNCGEITSLAAAPNVAVNLAAKQVYWSRLVRSSDTTPAGNDLQPGQVAIYPQPSFQGQPHVLDQGTVIYDNKNAVDFLGPNYQIGSLRLGPGTNATLFEKIMAEGRFHQFMADVPDVAKLGLDWPIERAASFRFCTAAQELIVFNLDGSNPTKLAGLPEEAPAVTSTGTVALDDERGLLFWIVPTGKIVRANLDGSSPVVIYTLNGYATGFGIAVDTVNHVVYCSEPYSSCYRMGYDGGENGMVPADPSWYLGEQPATEPPEFSELGRPPTMVVADAANQRLLTSNGQQIWRIDLTDYTWLPSNAPPLKDWVALLYESASICRGLAFDVSTQMLYWIEDNVLRRMNVNTNLAGSDMTDSIDEVFTLQGVQGRILGFVLDTTTEAATETVMNAHAAQQAAQAKANDAIQAANDAAATKTQTAQKNLDAAHQTAAGNIAATQASAALTRQNEQAAAQTKRDAAAAAISAANVAAAGAKAKATAIAQGNISQQQLTADQQKATAQASLDAARRQLQNT
jgi:hypothetical protein